MTKISGIFAASMSVLNNDLSLNVEKTITHAEKLIDQGCHGTVIFGSTGQSQLIPISEKIDLLNNLSKSKYQDKHIICLLYTSPSPRDPKISRMPSSA